MTISIPPAILKRKPARKVIDVPQEVLTYLNAGTIASANLTEWLAIDPIELVGQTFPAFRPAWVNTLTETIKGLEKPTAMAVTKALAIPLVRLARGEGCVEEAQAWLLAQPSDTLRGYGGTMIAALDYPLAELLTRLRPLAADAHFGPREIAMIAAKPAIAANLSQAIKLLVPFVSDPDENIRRFAVEATRPVGVWTAHIGALKEKPSLGLPLLEPLLADPSRYVQNAVANWLNDAAKHQPEWVIEVCQEWESRADAKATAYIVKRAKRSL